MLLERSSTPDPGPFREPHGFDRGVIRTISWYLPDDFATIEPGDVRLIQLAIRCVGPLSFHSELSLGFEVVGVE